MGKRSAFLIIITVIACFGFLAACSLSAMNADLVRTKLSASVKKARPVTVALMKAEDNSSEVFKLTKYHYSDKTGPFKITLDENLKFTQRVMKGYYDRVVIARGMSDPALSEVDYAFVFRVNKVTQKRLSKGNDAVSYPVVDFTVEVLSLKGPDASRNEPKDTFQARTKPEKTKDLDMDFFKDADYLPGTQSVMMDFAAAFLGSPEYLSFVTSLDMALKK